MQVTVATPAARSGSALPIPRGLVVAVAVAAACVLGVAAVYVLVHDHGQDAAEAAAQVVVAWTFVASGLIASWRRPQSCVGALLVGAGLALLVRRLQYSHASPLFTFGFAGGEISNAFIAHAVLAYPTGRLAHRAERAFVVLAYGVGLAFPLAALFFYDPASSCFFDCGGAHAHSVVSVLASDEAASTARIAYRVVAFGLLGVAFVVLVARKLLATGSAGRRLLAPLLVASAAAGIRAVSEAALTFANYSETARRALFWWQIAAQVAIPLALLVGLLRGRLARAAVADVLPALGRARPAEVAQLLASALGDRTLDVAFWVPEEHGYVDEGGRPVVLPARGDGRAVTEIVHDGEPVAALVHDPALNDEPELVEDVAAAAHLALENARLQAELQAQLVAVRESRARIVAAADEERRRIERDLHDGAQQRLLALGLALASAERGLAGLDREELRRVLEEAVSGLREAGEELRELAHGLHPTILTEQGLAAALSRLADRASVPTELDLRLGESLPVQLEATIYYVVCEALANVEKHARASHVRVRVMRERDGVVAEVTDDGIGGADPVGSGLRGLRDRVEANGGRITVSGEGGAGTRVLVELPCES